MHDFAIFPAHLCFASVFNFYFPGSLLNIWMNTISHLNQIKIKVLFPINANYINSLVERLAIQYVDLNIKQMILLSCMSNRVNQVKKTKTIHQSLQI